MVLFCTVGAPLVLVAAIAYLWFGNILGMNLRPVLLMLDKLKEWVMLDIYLVGVGVASIKVQDYAFLQPGVGLFAFICLVLLSILTLIHLNVEQLWERFYPQRPPRARTRISGSVWAATTPGCPMRAAAAHAAIFPCDCGATIACKMLGRPHCLVDIPASCQHVADIHYLREWRAAGGYHPLGHYLPCAQ